MVELLVVIFIIGIGLALLPVFLLQPRGHSRRAICANNVKQLSLALHTYHNLHKMYPINWGVVATGPTPEKIVPPTRNGASKGFSWLCMILPLVEEEQLYEQIDFEGTLAQNRIATQKSIPAFHCPSATHEGSLKNQVRCSAVTNYKSVAGANWPGANWRGGSSGQFRYKKTDVGPPKGPYTGRNADTYDGLDFGDGWCCRGASGPGTSPPGKPITTMIAQVIDGTSHTFAIGEAIPEYCNWSGWFYSEGATATCGIPLNWKPGGGKTLLRVA